MRKRLLAFLCAFTMIASVGAGVSNEKTVLAEGENPTVQLVGATIAEKSGASQSLRFLLKVSNYRAIKADQDFGIALNVSGKKPKTISYKTAKEIYGIDEETNTLEYVVEVTGITNANIDTSITAKGFITDGAGENPGYTESMPKSVSGVAEAAGYDITTKANGTLLLAKKIELSDANEALHDYRNSVSYEGGKAEMTLSKEFGGRGVLYYLAKDKKKIDASKYSKIVVNYTYTGTENKNIAVITKDCEDYSDYNTVMYNTPSVNSSDQTMTTGEHEVTLPVTKDIATIGIVNSTWAETNGGQNSDLLRDAELTVNSIKLYAKIDYTGEDIISVDLDDCSDGPDWIAEKASHSMNPDGTVTINWAENATNYAPCIFTFDTLDLSDFKYCVIDAEGDNMSVAIRDSADKDLCCIYGNPYPLKISLPKSDSQEGDITKINKISIFKLTDTQVYSLKVKSIKFYKNESDLPK